MVRFYQPDRERESPVRFLIPLNLEYFTRLALIAGCLCFGLAVQVLASVWVGWLLVLVGALMGATRGIHNKPSLRGPRRWEQVTLDEFNRVVEVGRRARRWSWSVFNLTSWPGALTFLATAVVVLWVGGALGKKGDLSPLAGLHFLFELTEWSITDGQKLWLLDAVALVLPIWLSGFLSAWEPDELLIKVKCLLEASEYVSGLSSAGLTLVPQLEVASRKPSKSPRRKRGLPKPEQERQLPRDARLQVRFDDAPEEFLGVQIQLSINRVGQAYPYLYCVLLAKQGFGLRERLGGVGRVGKDMLEYSSEEDVEVVVYRQYTTRKTGYHTNYRARMRVISGTFRLARQILEAPAPTETVAPTPRPVVGDRSVGRAPRPR